MSTWTGPGTWEALGKGNYPWIPRTTLNFPAAGSLRSLEKRAVRWDPEDAQDLDPGAGKEVQERAGRKGLDVERSKRLYGNGRSCEQLLALSNALPPPRWLCHPRRTKPGLSSPCSWNAQTLRPVIYQAAGELSSAALTAAPQSFPVSQRSLPGVPRVSKAPARTQGRSWEEPQRWSQGTGTRGHSAEAATAAMSSQDTGARSHPPGLGGGRGAPMLSTAHHPPRKNP